MRLVMPDMSEIVKADRRRSRTEEFDRAVVEGGAAAGGYYGVKNLTRSAAKSSKAKAGEHWQQRLSAEGERARAATFSRWVSGEDTSPGPKSFKDANGRTWSHAGTSPDGRPLWHVVRGSAQQGRWKVQTGSGTRHYATDEQRARQQRAYDEQAKQHGARARHHDAEMERYKRRAAAQKKWGMRGAKAIGWGLGLDAARRAWQSNY